MFEFKKCILQVQIRNFEPLTDNNNPHGENDKVALILKIIPSKK